MKTITGFLLGVTTTMLAAMVCSCIGIREELSRRPSGEYVLPSGIAIVDKKKNRQYLENKQKPKDHPIGFRAP